MIFFFPLSLSMSLNCSWSCCHRKNLNGISIIREWKTKFSIWRQARERKREKNRTILSTGHRNPHYKYSMSEVCCQTGFEQTMIGSDPISSKSLIETDMDGLVRGPVIWFEAEKNGNYFMASIKPWILRSSRTSTRSRTDSDPRWKDCNEVDDGASSDGPSHIDWIFEWNSQSDHIPRNLMNKPVLIKMMDHYWEETVGNWASFKMASFFLTWNPGGQTNPECFGFHYTKKSRCFDELKSVLEKSASRPLEMSHKSPKSRGRMQVSRSDDLAKKSLSWSDVVLRIHERHLDWD